MPVVPFLPAIAGVAGAAIGANAQNKAANQGAAASQQAADAATAEQRRQFDISQGNMQPWLQAGQQSVGHYANLLGLNGPGASAEAQRVFQASPDYQFRLNESMRGLTARNSALGIQDSGAAQRAALALAGNQASGEFNNYANRLAGLAGVGQTAASNQAQLGQSYAGAIGGIAQNNAQNLASSYAMQGANNANLWGGIGGAVGSIFNNLPTRR